MSYMRIIQEGFTGVTDLSNEKEVNKLYAAWYRVIMQYTARQLTMETDKLVALAGLASEMQKVLNKAHDLQSIKQADLYVLGLWRNQLWIGLLWVSHWDNSLRGVLSGRRHFERLHGPGRRSTGLSPTLPAKFKSRTWRPIIQ